MYSYLKSGVPILATDLLTLTQVLDNAVSVLTDPTPEALADGLMKLYSNPDLRSELSRAAIEREKTHYSYPAYREKISQLLKTDFGADSITASQQQGSNNEQ